MSDSHSIAIKSVVLLCVSILDKWLGGGEEGLERICLQSLVLVLASICLDSTIAHVELL